MTETPAVQPEAGKSGETQAAGAAVAVQIPSLSTILTSLLNGKAPVTLLGAVLAFVLLYLTPTLMERFDAVDSKVSTLNDKITQISAALEGRLLRLELLDQTMESSKAKWDKHCEESKTMEVAVLELRSVVVRLEQRLDKLEAGR